MCQLKKGIVFLLLIWRPMIGNIRTHHLSGYLSKSDMLFLSIWKCLLLSKTVSRQAIDLPLIMTYSVNDTSNFMLDSLGIHKCTICLVELVVHYFLYFNYRIHWDWFIYNLQHNIIYIFFYPNNYYKANKI